MISEQADPAHALESDVRSYSRSFPIVIQRAKGARLWTDDGSEYIDFLAGAGSLNYGHNNPLIKQSLIDYLQADGLLNGLDMASVAKNRFIETFQQRILAPRNLDYKLQFCGPTGTNAVEAALKLARKVKQRSGIISFTNGFHGMTLGSLAVTGNEYHKEDIYCAGQSNVTFMPYDGYVDGISDTTQLLRKCLEDSSSGTGLPAAVILETVQGEGGVNVASPEWLRSLQEICREFDVLLIVDDIQMGCGRTGGFFSFEEAGLEPDMVLLSKSIGAYGLPMSLVLLKPELDEWDPGQHNGTFRGNNLAFVAATRALELYWCDDNFSGAIRKKSARIGNFLNRVARQYPQAGFTVRGRGLVQGIEAADQELASRLRQRCFELGMIIETAGARDQVLKFLPPLTISEAELEAGLDIASRAFRDVMGEEAATRRSAGGQA